ncbi:MAG: HNH endonuclease [Micrococcales bacterium]|nr:HNH endonuclease [Micrococcales bacterium]
MAPGPQLAAVLERVDMDRVSDADLVVVLGACDRMASWTYEISARASAQVADRVARTACRAGRKDTGCGRSSAAAQEVALALGCSRGSAARLVSQGRALADAIPGVAAELRAGRLPAAHAKVLADRLGDESVQVCDAVLAVVLPGACELTPRTLGVAVDTALHEVDPDRALVDQQARTWRRVGSPCPLGQGMASLTAVLPVVDAARVDKTLEHVARAAHAAGDLRTINELRADIMVDVLTGDAHAHTVQDRASGQADTPAPAVVAPHDDDLRDLDERCQWRLPPPGSVHVNVTISASSLLGVTDEPGHVVGAGTIDAVTARALAHDGPWRRIVTDPLTGAVLDVGRTRYRPPAALAAHVAARDPHCVCATCTQPAGRCDLDHTTEWRDGGTTTTSNLAPLCRASDTLKTDGHLHLTTTAPGVYQWTTALGMRYQVDTTGGLPRRRPVPTIRDDIPPPF